METDVTSAERDQAMVTLTKIFTLVYGERCTDNEAGCMGCTAWGVYDLVVRLTDSSLIDAERLR